MTFDFLYNIRQDKMEKYDLWMDDTAIINFLVVKFKRDDTPNLQFDGKVYFRVTYKEILESLYRLRYKSKDMLKLRLKHYKDIKLIERPEGLGDTNSYMRFNNEVLYELSLKFENKEEKAED